MKDTGSADPFSAQLDNLRHMLTDKRFRAATQTGALAIEVAVDGTIASWHLDDSLHTINPRDILATFVKLHAKATHDAHTALTDASKAAADDPRFRSTIDQLANATDQPDIAENHHNARTGQSPDRSVTVEVDPDGIITEIRLDEYAQTLRAYDLAEAIMRAQRAARGTTAQPS